MTALSRIVAASLVCLLPARGPRAPPRGGGDAPDPCADLPLEPSGQPAYNVADPSRPFVVGRADDVSLVGKSWNPGPRDGPPTVYAVEQARLAVVDAGDRETALGFRVVLCGHARLEIARSRVRLEHDVVAAGSSMVSLSSSRVEAAEGARLVVSATAEVTRSEVLAQIVPGGRAAASFEDSHLGDLLLEPCSDASLRLVQGPAARVEGLAAGAVDLANTAVDRIHLAPGPGTDVQLLEGSAVADCLPPPGGSIVATGATLVGGRAYVAPDARLHLVRSSLQEPLENLGPFLCQRCDLRSSLTTRSTVWLADTRLGSITKDARHPGSQFYEVSLMSPQDGERVSGEVVVKGTLTANGVMTEKLIPFPPVTLDLVRPDTGARRRLAAFDNVRHFEELHRFDAAALEPGAWELQLHFDSELGARAAATRSIVVERKARACGCGPPGQAPGGLGLLLVLCALRRRRP